MAAAEEGKAGKSAETKPGESSLNTVKGWLTDELNVAIAIGLFSICSASMLLLNKCVADAFHLDASVVIAQMSFAFIVLPVLPAAFLGKLHFGHWKDVALWSCTVPLLFSFMMVTSISALRNSSVGASNVVRNLSPLLMLPVETLLQEKVEYDVHTLVSLFVILGGVVIYVREDVRTSPLGVVLLVVNMILAMTDRLVQRRFIAVTPLDISKTGMVWLNNTIGILPQIGMLFVFNEPAQWSERLNAVQIPQWIAFGFSCALGIGIGWTAVNAQKYVSATTFMVVGNVNKLQKSDFGRRLQLRWTGVPKTILASPSLTATVQSGRGRTQHLRSSRRTTTTCCCYPFALDIFTIDLSDWFSLQQTLMSAHNVGILGIETK